MHDSVSLDKLTDEEKRKRADSFGAIASHYERHRPGPPIEVAEWFVPDHVSCVVDLGAGTGALTRSLIGRADEVVAVEPDARMREVLSDIVPEARALEGKGESIPLPSTSADAVLASSSWHWMDSRLTLDEVARVLIPGGVLGVVWGGPDPDGPLMVQARELFKSQLEVDRVESDEVGDTGSKESVAAWFNAEANRPTSMLEIPDDAPFDEPEKRAFAWSMGLKANDLIGLLSTMSWCITMEPIRRSRVLDTARTLLADMIGTDDDATVDMPFRAEAWMTHLRA